MNWFRNRRTATKLMLGFGVVVAVVIVVAVVGASGMESMNTSTRTLYQVHALGLTHLKNAQIELLRTSRAVRNAILDDNEAGVRRRMSDIAKFREGFRREIEEFRKTAVLKARGAPRPLIRKALLWPLAAVHSR